MSLGVILDYVIDREIRRQADWWGLDRKLLGDRQVCTTPQRNLYFESALPAQDRLKSRLSDEKASHL
jgi:hypothetical protein